MLLSSNEADLVVATVLILSMPMPLTCTEGNLLNKELRCQYHRLPANALHLRSSYAIFPALPLLIPPKHKKPNKNFATKRKSLNAVAISRPHAMNFSARLRIQVSQSLDGHAY